MDPENIKNEELINKLRKPTKSKYRRLLLILVILVGALFITSYTYQYFGLYSVSENRIHWHAHLAITGYGQGVTIPAGTGLTAQIGHPEILHTHADDGIIHMEFGGPVQARTIMLGEFLKVWGKSFGQPTHMFVNGKENFDYYRYVMRDNDQIELIYE